MYMDVPPSQQPSKEEEQAQEARALDLTNVERIVRGRMPGLEMVYDRFVRGVRGVFARELGVNCSVELGALEQEKYGPWLQKMTPPVCAHLITLSPLNGSSVVVFSPQLAGQVVDLLMGGSGAFASAKRERVYTDIERRLLEKFISALLIEYGFSWESLGKISPSYKSMETAPQALGVAAPTDWVSLAHLDVELAGKTSRLTVAVPMFSLSVFRDKLEAGNVSTSSQKDGASKAKLREHLKQTELNLSVVLAEGKMTAGEVLNLQVGDVIALDAGADEDAVVMVEGKPKYKAEIGTKSGNRAAIIKRKLD